MVLGSAVKYVPTKEGVCDRAAGVGRKGRNQLSTWGAPSQPVASPVNCQEGSFHLCHLLQPLPSSFVPALGPEVRVPREFSTPTPTTLYMGERGCHLTAKSPRVGSQRYGSLGERKGQSGFLNRDEAV